MDALLSAPDRETPQGRRDYALLLFLYNSGARASEAAQLLIRDVDLPGLSVRIIGKGNKQRLCPLWPTTVDQLMPLIAGRSQLDHVFLNRCGQPVTRFGIHTLVERSASRACTQAPSLESKRVSPHTIRHSSATDLLLSGVDNSANNRRGTGVRRRDECAIPKKTLPFPAALMRMTPSVVLPPNPTKMSLALCLLPAAAMQTKSFVVRAPAWSQKPSPAAAMRTRSSVNAKAPSRSMGTQEG